MKIDINVFLFGHTNSNKSLSFTNFTRMNEILRAIGFSTEPTNPEQQDLLMILKFKFSHPSIPVVGARTFVSPVEQTIINYQKRYTSAELARFTTLFNENTPIESIFEELGFPIKPNIEILNEIRSTIQNNQLSDVLVFGALHQGLAWMAESIHDINFAVTLLTVYQKFIESQYSKQTDCIFRLLLKVFLDDSNLEINDSFCAAVLSYLIENYSIKENFTEIFCSFFSKILNSGLPRSINHILRVTRQFINEHRPFVPIGPGSSIFPILATLIQTLDPNAIELICVAATTNDTFIEDIRSLLDLLAKSLIEKILSTEPFNSTFEVDASPDIEFPLEFPILEDNYRFITDIDDLKYNSAELAPLLDTISSPSIDLFSYLPTNSKNVVSLIVNMFASINHRYLESFLGILSDTVINNIGDPYYIDLYSVMLFFYEKLNERFSLLIFLESLLSPVIFHSKYSIFGEDQIPPQINDFRIFTFSVISMQMQTLQCQLLNYAAKRSPLLFAEQISRVVLTISNFKLELFCSESIHRSIMCSSLSLQQLFKENPKNSIRLARIAIFQFIFELIESSTSFLLSSSSPIFSKGYFYFLFEPSLTNLLLTEIRNGFVGCTITFTLPIFLQVIPILCHIIDFCADNIENEPYKNLAEQIIKCITDSLTHNPQIIHSLMPVFEAILNYVSKAPQSSLLQECFQFLSILSQVSTAFIFSSEMFQLLSEIIRSVEGNEPSLTTQLKFYNLLSGANQSTDDALFLIQAPQFIPLFLVAYSQSVKINKLIDFFSSLCKYSPANCIACNNGDLDFLLLQFLKHNKSFEFNGYKIDFLIDIEKSLDSILQLISLITHVKTNVVICDQLIKLTLPSSPYFKKNVANSILTIISSSIASEITKMHPIFNMVTNKLICQIKGVHDRDINNNFAVSFWVNLDIPQLMSTSESYCLFTLESADKNTSFKVFMNGASVFASYRKDGKGNKATPQNNTISAILSETVPSNEWILFTIDVRKSNGESIVYLYKFTDQIGFASFKGFAFHSNRTKLTFGPALYDKSSSSSENKNTNKIIGQLGPFCFFDPTSDLHNNVPFSFQSDPNFENFPSAFFSSVSIENPNTKENTKDKYEISVAKMTRSESCLNDVLYNVYDLNYMTFHFTQFKPDEFLISLPFLKIILSSLSSSIIAQEKFTSTPILATYIPKVFKGNLNYKLYITLFSSLSTFKYDPLIHEFLELIIFNLELWGQADFQSILRIVKHWETSAYVTFTTTNSNPWKLSRLLAVFDILFFSNNTPKICKEDSIEIQTDFSLQERCLIHSFRIGHTNEEVQQCKESFLDFIEFMAQTSLTSQDVLSIYSHLFASTNKEKTILLLNLVDHLGSIINSLPKIRTDLVKPLQYFFNTDDCDVIAAAVSALYSLSKENVHLLLSTASIQITMNADFSPLFSLLLTQIRQKVNLYSLICVLALALGKEEQEAAVGILRVITDDKEMINKVDRHLCWSIWPVCIGLRGTEPQKQVVAEFLANQILRFKDVIAEFQNILSVTVLLANDWKTAAYEMQSELTFVLAKMIFRSKNSEIVKIQQRFLLTAFSSVFFYHLDFRNRGLYEEFVNSPFYAHQPVISPMKRRYTEPAIRYPKQLHFKPTNPETNETNSNPKIIPHQSSTNVKFDISSLNPPINIEARLSTIERYSTMKRTLTSKNPPFTTFLSFTGFQPPAPVSTPLAFRLRIADNGKWVDDKLCFTLISLIPSLKNPPHTLMLYKEVAEFLKNGRDNRRLNDMNRFHNKIFELQPSSIAFDSSFIFQSLSAAFNSARKMINEGLYGIRDSGELPGVIDIENEISLLEHRQQRCKKAMVNIKKKYVYPRDTQLHLDHINDLRFYKRDNCTCFDFCPFKLRPVLKQKSYKVWELRKTNGNLVDIETQTDEVEEPTKIKDSGQMSTVLPCVIVKSTKTRKATFMLYVDQIQLVDSSNPEKVNIIHFYKIINIFKRRRYQKDTAIEIFLTNGKSFLIDFTPNLNTEIISQLSTHHFSSIKHIQQGSARSLISDNHTTALWRSGQLSNFTYLMVLNTYSGRTFNDIHQYPMIPRITVDLKNISRNLSYPPFYQKLNAETGNNIPVNSKTDVNTKKIDEIENMSDDSETIDDAENFSVIDMEIEQLFHPSPLPPSTVDNFLVRIEPFTSLHLNMQSGKFYNDKLFRSLGDYLQSSELSPEFFFCPEFLLNLNSLQIPDFKLPDNLDAFTFVYSHRKLLESDYVSQNLHKWIDLIWGVKQKGELAKKYHNFMHPFILENVWESEASVLVKADDQVLSMMRIYGLMPQQLFTENHPAKSLRPQNLKTSTIQKNIHAIPIIYACCIADNGFLAIDSNGKIFTGEIRLSINDQIIKQISNSSLNVTTETLMCPIEKGMLFYSPTKETLSLFQYGNIRTFQERFSNVDSICGSRNYFLIVKDRTVISVYDTITFPAKLGEIIILEDVIMHCQISRQFGVIDVLSRNGIIHIHSLSTFQKTAVIDISKDKPRKMIITPRWGFIVVDCGDKLKIYNINGLFIKEQKFDNEICSWYAVSSLKDFDYILFEDNKENIGYFEAFEPSNIKILTQAAWAVCHMDYCRSEDCMYMLTSQGHIIIVSHPFVSE
ncbi:hypothetical protein TRFO_23575 [Tritrichomonas foetus]|uniref:Beige/BEACH domain containing protein n=1 Tax=Tritrichomonas foetus TaxID=1144522 RepID=A0A1J4KAQ8_9EUKA|nr:hypothetical protein TRFO_23575 [Tritrichomonas foetus]|eukprot:OHT08042.1 hypothetical protein TRFO_23575 [Tritrichomonas foetus]